MSKTVAIKQAYKTQDELYEAYMNDEISEEEMDRYFAIKKTNGSKHFVPAFILDILMNNSSAEDPLTRADILNFLHHEPYCTDLEKKALSRDLNGLVDFGIGIRTCRAGTTNWYWYDSGKKYTDFSAARVA